MTVGSADHVETVFLEASSATQSSSIKTAAVTALYKSLNPNQNVTAKGLETLKEKLRQEDRLTIERYIVGLVIKICSEANEHNILMMEYIHPLSNPLPVLSQILDMVLALGEEAYLEPGFIFTLIQQLVEMSMKAEENLKLIDWIVDNKDKLKQEHVLSRGKLIFLRAVNRMLKLLQKGEVHSSFYGRMLFCMSELYTMAERSATNHSGLKDLTHPVNIQSWNRPIDDDFGKTVDKGVYLLYWRLMESVQGSISTETEANKVMDGMHKLLDCFKSRPCRQSSLQLPITLINNTSPEQFNQIFRDPDCRMECLVQIYVCLQRLLAPMRHPVIISESVKLRIASSQQALVNYILSDAELKLRWTPIQPSLAQEPSWIEWKNNGAKEWTSAPSKDHPWTQKYTSLADNLTIEEITQSVVQERQEMMDMDPMDSSQEESWEMKAAEGLHGQFNRDLELPDLEEIKVPIAKEFLKNVLEDKEELQSSAEILELDTSFCWRTYRLLSEDDISCMVNSEHRTNFVKLLKDLDLQKLHDPEIRRSGEEA